MAIPSAQFSLTLRVELPHESGTLSKVTAAISKVGGAIVAVDPEMEISSPLWMIL